MTDDILDIEMSQATKQIIEHSMYIQPDETVLIITDPKKLSVAKNIAIAANSAGAETIISIMPLLEAHGNEPPQLIADSMVNADAVITCTTHAISHTNARRRAAEAGVKLGVMRGVTDEMMIEGAMTVDFKELKEITDGLVSLLTAADHARVTSDNGTDVELGLVGSESQPVDGLVHEDAENPVKSGASFPPGEAPILPEEGTAQGTIVIDVSIDNIGKLSEPIRLEFEDGFVTDVSGGDEAAELREIIDSNDENAGNLAEFAIGTNKKARLIGNLAEDKKKAGTVHFAIGDNMSLGGTIESSIHLDGVIRSPTVYLDGEIIVEDGQILYEKLP